MLLLLLVQNANSHANSQYKKLILQFQIFKDNKCQTLNTKAPHQTKIPYYVEPKNFKGFVNKSNKLQCKEDDVLKIRNTDSYIRNDQCMTELELKTLEKNFLSMGETEYNEVISSGNSFMYTWTTWCTKKTSGGISTSSNGALSGAGGGGNLNGGPSVGNVDDNLNGGPSSGNGDNLNTNNNHQSSNNDPTPSSHQNTKISTELLIAIIGGCIVLLLILIFIYFYCKN